MLFQVVLIDLMNLLMPLFLFSGYILLVIGGTMDLKRTEKVEKSVLFTIIGAVGIISEVIMVRIYYLVDEIFNVGFEEHWVIVYIIPNIISILTFGVLIIVLGKLNRENFGKYLLISGIFWTIYAVMILMLNVRTIIPFFPLPFFIFNILGLIFLVFMIGARILFTIYASKIDNVILLVSSIALLISSTAYVVFSLLLAFMPIFYI